MNITRKDAVWNIVATILKVGSSFITLPLMMRFLSTEEYGLWIIFLSYGSLILLIDFGFSNSFTRNITYIFSGAKELVKTGFVEVGEDKNIDYGLLKSVIKTMRYFYSLVAFIAFILLGVIGIIHLYLIMHRSHYTGNHLFIYIAWCAYICLISYQLYTLYYESLLMGRGFIKQQMKITIITQCLYLLVVSIAIINGLGLLSMVIGLIISITTNRILSKKVFFDKILKNHLSKAIAQNHKKFISLFAHNSIKVGLITFGSFMTSRSAILIGSLYLPLSTIASFGLSKQLVDITISIALIWFTTFYPKITFFKINGDAVGVKRLYLKSWIVFVGLFCLGILLLILFGNWVLLLIKSKTLLVSSLLLFSWAIIGFLETNQNMANGLLLSENKVPFFQLYLISGGITIGLLFICLKYLHLEIWGIVLAVFFANLYQNWKLPYTIIKKYNFTIKDYVLLLKY